MKKMIYFYDNKKNMSPVSLFPHDVRKEQLLGAFLDGLYQELGMHFERVTDKEMQHRGVDIIVTRDGQRFLVDEKAQLDYLNVSMPTFAFEIGGFREEEHKMGWLFDAKKRTTHYMLITDIYLKEGKQLRSAEDIASVCLLWLNREKLITFLAGRGLDRARCELAEQEARERGTNGRIATGQRGLYFFLSAQKAEAPFNIVITREHLLKIGKQLFPPVRP